MHISFGVQCNKGAKNMIKHEAFSARAKLGMRLSRWIKHVEWIYKISVSGRNLLHF